MKIRFRLISIFCAASALLLIVSPAAQAGYVVTLQQVGSNVVANGSGPLDLTGLTFDFPTFESAGIRPNGAVIVTGSSGTGNFFTGFTGPTSFGSGSTTAASSSSGNIVGIAGTLGDLIVPQIYTSGDPLSDSAIYNGATFATLGVTPGTYVWTWGTGVNQNFTLQIETPTVPDSGSTLGLLFLAVIALLGGNRFRFLQAA